MILNRRAIYGRVIKSWLHTLLVLFVIVCVMLIALWLSFRFAPFRVVLAIMMGGWVMALFVYIISEPLIILIFQGRVAKPEEYPVLCNEYDQLCRGRRLWLRPRLYILKMDVPNAMAFGLGFFGQCGIGVTKGLLDILKPSELRAVLGHELAHVRSKDVGLMTIFGLIAGAGRELVNLFLNGRTALAKSPLAFLVGGVLWVITRLILPIGQSALSVEREYAADALSTLYCGQATSLISALRKLGGSHLPKQENGFLDDLMISHPNMDDRIAMLEQYSSQPA